MKLPSLPFFRKKDPRKEFERKMAKCRREAEENPNDLRLMTKIAELYLENGDTENAIEEYLNVAKAYQSIRKNSIVVGIFRHILTLDPSRIDIYHMLVDELMKDLLTGDAVEVMVKLAIYYYDNDMHFEAAQAIKKIKAIDPDNKFYSSKVEKFFTDRNLDPEAVEKIGPRTKWSLIAHKCKPRRVRRGPLKKDSSTSNRCLTNQPFQSSSRQCRRGTTWIVDKACCPQTGL